MELSQARVLVVDDNRDILTALRLLLKRKAAQVQITEDPRQLPLLMSQQSYDLVLLDMNFTQDQASGEEGLHYLAQIRQQYPEVAVVMMTAFGELNLAVTAMKAGARDFITKPWCNDALLATLSSAIAGPNTSSVTPTPNPKRNTSPEFLGRSPAMQRVFATIERVASTDANVLILGESGTGKALVAQALHQASERRKGALVSVDMGTLGESLMASELFGHKKGAFTDAKSDRVGRFEEAQGGSLFLDELGNLPLPQQAQLLTALQERTIQRVGCNQLRPIDIRLICATNDNLSEKVAAGAFRQDLLYRINTVEIQLPPLRERGDDILMLAEHYLAQFQQQYRRPVHALSPEDRAALLAYPWPGNVRELAHAMERLVILSSDEGLDLSLLALSAPSSSSSQHVSSAVDLDALNLEQLEQLAIEKAMREHKGNISRAASALGLTRAALYRRLEKYEM